MSVGENIWMEIVRIHEADKAKPLNQIDGLWRRELADGWSIVVNGHKEPIKDGETQFEVAPYKCNCRAWRDAVSLLWATGWPAALRLVSAPRMRFGRR